MTPAKIEKMKWPKKVTELHMHLGGSVPIYRLWEMGLNRGIRGMGQSYKDFIDLVKINPNRVSSLDEYLEIYDRIELIQSGPESVRESIIIAVNGAHRTGGMRHLGPGGEGGDPSPLFSIGKLELRFNPLKRTGAVFLKGKHAGLYDADRIIKSACIAIEELEIGFRGEMQLGLLFCFGRDVTHEANMILAEKIAQWRESSPKIVGLDLAGPESRNPLSDKKKLAEMIEAFDTAGKNLKRTIHVGETEHVDLNTFLRTVEALRPERVAHPIAVFRSYWRNKDDRGLKLLKERKIISELCVKSNLLTGAVKNLEEYKKIINTLDKFEIPYTFSTDAPGLQVSSLAGELMMLLENGIASSEQVLRALRVADKASFI